MKRFIQGEHLGQGTLLPESLDDYVSDTNPVRVVDVFVDELDLRKRGFEGVIPANTGRPAYHPAPAEDLPLRLPQLHSIKPSNGARSPAQHRVDMVDWSRDAGLQNHRQFSQRQWQGKPRGLPSICGAVPATGIFSEALAAIHGGKFKVINNRDRNFTSAKLRRRLEEIESSFNRYLTALDTADRQEPLIAQAKAERLHDKIAALKPKMQELKEVEVQLNETPEKQISLSTRQTPKSYHDLFQTKADTSERLLLAVLCLPREAKNDPLLPITKGRKRTIDLLNRVGKFAHSLGSWQQC
jgi:hypothetical protein